MPALPVISIEISTQIVIDDRAARPCHLQEPMNKLEIGKCTFTNCSIGISLDEDHLGGEVNPESGKVVVRVDEESGQVVQGSPGTPKSLKVDPGLVTSSILFC